MASQRSQSRCSGDEQFLKGTTALLMAAGVRSQFSPPICSRKTTANSLRCDSDWSPMCITPTGRRRARGIIGKSLRSLPGRPEQFTKDRVDFVAELGDFIDSAPSLKEEQGFLGRVNEVFAAMRARSTMCWEITAFAR